jgi:hypothetical protein
MTYRSKILLVFLMLSVYGIQIFHTISNQINWPFCSHNLYYHRSSLTKDLFRVILENNLGDSISLNPRNTLPIEGYRCGSIFREIFITNQDLKKKELFSRLLLARLNQGGWRGFDERFVSATPLPGSRFIGLTVEKHWVDTTLYAKSQQLPLIKRKFIYQYKEESHKK